MTKNDILTHLSQIVREAERCYWWTKDIPADVAQDISINNELSEIRKHLVKVDQMATEAMVKVKGS